MDHVWLLALMVILPLMGLAWLALMDVKHVLTIKLAMYAKMTSIF
jgi:hypothetical protein